MSKNQDNPLTTIFLAILYIVAAILIIGLISIAATAQTTSSNELTVTTVERNGYLINEYAYGDLVASTDFNDSVPVGTAPPNLTIKMELLKNMFKVAEIIYSYDENRYEKIINMYDKRDMPFNLEGKTFPALSAEQINKAITGRYRILSWAHYMLYKKTRSLKNLSAMKMFSEKVLETNPKNGMAWLRISQYYGYSLEEHLPAEAIPFLIKSSQINGEDTWVKNYLKIAVKIYKKFNWTLQKAQENQNSDTQIHLPDLEETQAEYYEELKTLL